MCLKAGSGVYFDWLGKKGLRQQTSKGSPIHVFRHTVLSFLNLYQAIRPSSALPLKAKNLNNKPLLSALNNNTARPIAGIETFNVGILFSQHSLIVLMSFSRLYLLCVSISYKRNDDLYSMVQCEGEAAVPAITEFTVRLDGIQKPCSPSGWTSSSPLSLSNCGPTSSPIKHQDPLCCRATLSTNRAAS